MRKEFDDTNADLMQQIENEKQVTRVQSQKFLNMSRDMHTDFKKMEEMYRQEIYRYSESCKRLQTDLRTVNEHSLARRH
jgi:hypothetical protein